VATARFDRALAEAAQGGEPLEGVAKGGGARLRRPTPRHAEAAASRSATATAPRCRVAATATAPRCVALAQALAHHGRAPQDLPPVARVAAPLLGFWCAAAAETSELRADCDDCDGRVGSAAALEGAWCFHARHLLTLTRAAPPTEPLAEAAAPRTRTHAAAALERGASRGGCAARKAQPLRRVAHGGSTSHTQPAGTQVPVMYTA